MKYLCDEGICAKVLEKKNYSIIEEATCCYFCNEKDKCEDSCEYVNIEKGAFNCDSAHEFNRDCIEDLIKDKRSRICDYEDNIRKLNKQIKDLEEYLEECE